MSKRMKTVVCLFMSLLLMLPLNLIASAATVPEESQVQPRWSYTDITYVAIAIDGSGNASCLADVQGYYGTTTKIHIKLTLQKYTVLWWSKVQTWEATFNYYYGTLNPSTTVGNGTYRVKAEFTVYSGSNSEQITSFSQEKKFTKS